MSWVTAVEYLETGVSMSDNIILVFLHPWLLYLLRQASKEADDNDGAADDPLRYGPRPEELVPRAGSTAGAAADGVYRPPKLNPAAMQVHYHERSLCVCVLAAFQASL